jgi:protein O-GlcNAc transferase
VSAAKRNRLLAQAEAYFRAGQHGHAKLILDNLIASDASSSKAFELLAYIHGNEGDLASAHRLLESACKLPGHSPEALYYLGVSHLKQMQPARAIDAFDRAIRRAGPFFEALHEKATAYSRLGDRRLALENYLRALNFNPKSFDLVFNIGKIYDETKDFKNAMTYYDRAIALNPNVADVWAHRGAVLYDSKDYLTAIASWERALAMAPDIDFLPGFLFHARSRLCDWHNWHSERAALLGRVENDEKACGPFELLAISDADDLPLKASRRWVEANFAIGLDAPAQGGRVRDVRTDDKIRIGYFSADFGRHAVSYLTAELYELHDRSRFEVYGFALEKAAQGDEMRDRLQRSFDHFYDVAAKSDADIVALVAGLDIDIAIDLGGHTKGARTGLFRDGVAPIQVNYLGFPGTMGASFIHYIIADEVTIPPDRRHRYSEKIVSMPDCFQPSDSQRKMSPSRLDRGSFGLPTDGFIYCCFNNSYKLNPHVFEMWMKILGKVEGSCLWLLSDSEQAEANLRREAGDRGIAADRIVFGGNLPLSDYLGRYRCADLFLDTLPFNGGTTANDALWAGLPVLTRPGRAFAGRMAASLLTALDLPELISRTDDEYEATAVRLAQHPGELARVREKLTASGRQGHLFDMPRYTRQLELAYRAMRDRCRAGLPPEHIEVAQLTP